MRSTKEELLGPSLPELHLLEQSQRVAFSVRIYEQICSFRSLPSLHLFEESQQSSCLHSIMQKPMNIHHLSMDLALLDSNWLLANSITFKALYNIVP